MRIDGAGMAAVALCLVLPATTVASEPPAAAGSASPASTVSPAPSPAPVAEGIRRLDAASVLEVLQRRYGSLRAHHERGQLIERIDVGDRVENRTETTVECVIREGRFAVTTTARRLRAMLGRVLPVRSGPGVAEAASELDQWIAPHAVLDREARTDLGPAAASRVRIDDREFIRLDLEGGGDRLELLVNPETVLVERASGQRPLPGGGSWRGQLDVRTVGEPEPPAEDLLRSLAAAESAADEADEHAEPESPRTPAPGRAPESAEPSTPPPAEGPGLREPGRPLS